jgi:AcrR family transcriptional regulator
VLRAALELADEGGISALTMRELGQRLGVEAMSLYNHIAGKDDILDGIVDLVVAEIDLPSGDIGWREAMRRRATSAREAFARHRWASALIDSRRSSGPGRMRYLEWVIGTLREAGFSPAMALHAFSAIDSYIYGFGRQQLNSASGGAGGQESTEAFLAAIPADEFPFVRELTGHVLRHGYDEAADFDFGLEVMLDGLQQQLDAAPRG